MKKSRPKILETLTAMQENIVCLQSQNFPRISSTYTHATHTHRSRDLGFLRFAHPGDERKRVWAREGAAQRRKVGSKGEKNARERVC